MKLTIQIPKHELKMPQFTPQTPSQKNIHIPKLRRTKGIRDFVLHLRKQLRHFQIRVQRLESVNGILTPHSDANLDSFIRLAHNTYLIRHLRRRSLEMLCEYKLLTIFNN